MYRYCLLACAFLWCQVTHGQFVDTEVKVYGFEEGLSHRNVFKILQDTSGYIWVATINGLNRFDGYEFVQYNSEDPTNYIPYDVISDMLIDDHNNIWLANPDYLTSLNPSTGETHPFQIKKGEIVRRESWVPYNLFLDLEGTIWAATYDEKSGDNFIQTIGEDFSNQQLFEVSGSYIKRPITQTGEYYFIGAFQEELWRIDEEKQIVEKIDFAPYSISEKSTRIVDLQVVGEWIWILLLNGEVLSYHPENQTVTPHPIGRKIANKGLMDAFLVEADGGIWVGGRGNLWYYNPLTKQVVDYNILVNRVVKNTCYYRQIFQDKTGVTWVATDFGVVKLTQAQDLFTNYLDGGSEYCSNVFCSTRGIAEDEEGNIYISYYNSIHVLNPHNNGLRLLFPSNDFFNYPFGLLYHDGALWTGNGRRIDLGTLSVDTLIRGPSIDLGAVMLDRDQEIWFGFQQSLYRYRPGSGTLIPYEDSYGRWDSLSGTITHLHQGKTNNYFYVSTMENGVFQLDKQLGRLDHYHAGEGSPVRLGDNQVNAVYEDDFGYLWLGTAQGLHKIDLATNELQIYTEENGLPNNFINGLASEADTCMWISTNNGLSRLSIFNETFSNFSTQDGLSSNEFNRMSFFKARNGRIYFGGLNGVNAFYPGLRYLDRRVKKNESHLIFTTFTKFDDTNDSLYVQQSGIQSGNRIVLTHNDKFFTFKFALADYQEPQGNQFSYILEGYEKNWSEPSRINSVRYNNVPAGTYTFRVRAKAAGKDWNGEEIALTIRMREAFYYTWWFWALCAGLITGSVWCFMRYRIYLIEKRELELEQQVKIRTEELENEKHKSEELLLNILPAEIAEELKRTGVAKAKRHESVTVMFSDFKSFTKISESMEPEELVAEIDLCFRAFDQIVEKYGLEKIKTIGDAYLCVGGIAGGGPEDARRIVEAGLEIQAFLLRTAEEKQETGAPYFEARIGVHTGPIVAGIVGIKKFVYDIWGNTVNIASRMETNGRVGYVNISETTYQLIKSEFLFDEHGVYSEIEKKPMKMYFVRGRNSGVPVI